MGDVAERQESQIVPTQDQGAALIQVIERAASNPEIDVEKMERLFAMHERIVGKQAEEAFNAAMSAAQAEMGRVSTDATNPQTRSRYATYGALDKALRPIYTKHGFALSFDSGESDKPDHERVICKVSHKAGHKDTFHKDISLDTAGIKGNQMMTKVHASGSATSYGMRYLLKMIFNVAIGEDDTDGNVPQGKITDEQAAELKALIQETNSDTTAFLKAMGGAPSVDELPAGKYQQALTALNKKLAKQRGGKADGR